MNKKIVMVKNEEACIVVFGETVEEAQKEFTDNLCYTAQSYTEEERDMLTREVISIDLELSEEEFFYDICDTYSKETLGFYKVPINHEEMEKLIAFIKQYSGYTTDDLSYIVDLLGGTNPIQEDVKTLLF